jgi:hypothetical protein
MIARFAKPLREADGVCREDGYIVGIRTEHRVLSPSYKVKRGIPPRQAMSFKDGSGRTASRIRK